MPRKPIRSKRKDGQGLTPEARQWLLNGWALGRTRGWTLPDAKALWKRHRRELLLYWCQDPAGWEPTSGARFSNPPPGGPNSRPWAWWQFDSPDHPMDPPADQAAYLRQLGLIDEGVEQ